MSCWVNQEVVGARMKDQQLKARLSQVLSQLSREPERSIPGACKQWSDVLGAYRFFDNDRVEFADILSGHKVATMARMADHPAILVAQDTTFLSFEKTQAKEGFGTVKETVRDEHLLHVNVAFTNERVNLGVLSGQLWQRTGEGIAKTRRQRSTQDKESQRWLDGYASACEVQAQYPQKWVISIADREGDIREWYELAEHTQERAAASSIVRAKQERRIEIDDDEYGSLWEWMAVQPVLGPYDFEVAAKGGQSARRAQVRVRAGDVTLSGRMGGAMRPVTLHAVFAAADNALAEVSPIRWMLLTNIPADTFETARAIIQWYRCRWEIEVCQTQPVNMTWCPLRHVPGAIGSLRGPLTREHVGDLHVLPGDDDCPDQALRDGLAFFNGEPVQVVAQQMPEGFAVRNDRLPMPRLLLRTSELLPCLLDLFAFGREFSPSTVPRIEADDLSLIGLESALALPLQALLALEQVGLLRRQGVKMVLCGVGPALMQLRNHRRPWPQLVQCRPDHGIEPVGTYAPGAAWLHTPTRQGRVPLARIVAGRICVAGAQLAATGHRQPAFATFIQPPPSVPAGGRLIGFAGQLGMAVPWDLGVLQQLTCDHGGGVAPHPVGRWAIAAPRFELVPLGCLSLTIAGEDRLAVMVPGLPSLGAIGEETSDGGRMPGLALARRGWRVGRVQALGALPATQVVLEQRTIHRLYDLGLRSLNHHLRRGTVAFGPIPISIAAVGPRDACAAAGLLQSPTTCAFKNLHTFIRGDHPRHLGQEFALGRVTKRMVEKNRLDVQCFELFDQQPWMRRVTGEPIG